MSKWESEQTFCTCDFHYTLTHTVLSAFGYIHILFEPFTFAHAMGVI